MKPKRKYISKRKSGAGRKPGPLGLLDDVIGLRIPRSLKNKIKRVSKANHRSMNSELVIRVIESFNQEEAI